MQTYRLYLESGPRRKKTLVHVLALPGCVVAGPTTDDALAAVPGAIQAYRRLLARHGLLDDTSGTFDTELAEHVTAGQFLGSGSPDALFAPDREPLTPDDLAWVARCFRALRSELVAWAAAQPAADLTPTPPDGGRSASAILRHVLEPTGAYLAVAFGGAPGFSALVGSVDRGQRPLLDALSEAVTLVEQRLRATTAAERSEPRARPGGGLRYPRQALRRVLEHDWEHLMELAARAGGPAL